MKRLTIGAALVLGACHDATGPSTAACIPGTTPPTLALNVGGVQALADPRALACMSIGASASPSEYVFVAANASSGANQAASYRIMSSFSVATAAAPAPAVAASLFQPPDDGGVDLRLRTMERRLLQLPGHALSASVAAAPPNVGDTLHLRVPDANASNACTSYFPIKAIVQAVTAHAIVVQDSAAPAGGFTLADFNAIGSEFETYSFPTDNTYFGAPTDLDGNGAVYLLYTPRVNALAPRGSGTFVGGFFFGGDLFSQLACPESNVGEIVYLIAPDPSGVFSDPRATQFVRQATRSTIAHEVEHLINLGIRLQSGARFESIWLDEALAHFAEEYVGRAEDGFGPFQKLTYSDVSANATDYQAFYRDKLLNLRSWLQRPDTGSSIANTDRNLSDGGAAWALLHYAADQYAGGDLPGFTRRLVSGPDSGLGNLTARAGAPFDSLMAGWMVAMYADGLGISGLAARYTFQSWNFRDVEAALSGAYPLQVRALGSGADVTAAAYPGSGNYFRLLGTPTTPAAVFRLVSTAGGLVTFPGARLYIVRTQ